MKKTPAQIEALLSSFLSALPAEASALAELSFSGGVSRSVAWADGKENLQESAASEGTAVRVIDRGRQGLVATSSSDPGGIKQAFDEACALAKATPPDPYRQFAHPLRDVPSPIPIDQSLLQEPLAFISDRLAAYEKRILEHDSRIKKVIKLHYEERLSTQALARVDSPVLMSESSVIGFSAEILAEENGNTEVAWGFQSRRFSKDMSMDAIIADLSRSVVQSLGGKPLPSAKMPVVVHSRVGVQLLTLVAEALSAEAVERGRSFLKGKLNKTIAAAAITLVDDPLLPDGVSSAPFDDEGSRHKTLRPVLDGVLTDYFFDVRTALKEGRESNGHGIKAGLGTPPRPAATNFYMKPGTASLEDLLGAESQVFLLKDVMGLHMADPITGEFSLGASGLLYEKGRFVRPVRGVTVAGSVWGLLESVSAVGNDLTWYGSIGSPSFFVPRVTVAGN